MELIRAAREEKKGLQRWMNSNKKKKGIGSQRTWISRESGCEARTPVHVRSDKLRAAMPLAALSAADDADEDEAAALDLAPLLAAAAAFFCAAFFLLASDTMVGDRDRDS